MFSIKFEFDPAQRPVLLPDEHNIESDCDPEDFVCLLSTLCNRLAQSNRFRFALQGFGKSDWQLDTGSDLCTFLEGLPPLLELIDNGISTPVTVDLYEQGTEMSLTFSIDRQDVTIECQTVAEPQPSPNQEIVSVKELQQSLRQIIFNFIAAVGEFAPKSYQETWFRSWCTSAPIRNACSDVRGSV